MAGRKKQQKINKDPKQLPFDRPLWTQSTGTNFSHYPTPKWSESFGPLQTVFNSQPRGCIFGSSRHRRRRRCHRTYWATLANFQPTWAETECVCGILIKWAIFLHATGKEGGAWNQIHHFSEFRLTPAGNCRSYKIGTFICCLRLTWHVWWGSLYDDQRINRPCVAHFIPRAVSGKDRDLRGVAATNSDE